MANLPDDSGPTSPTDSKAFILCIERHPADSAEALRIQELAFGQPDEAILTADLLKDPSAYPLLSLLAEQDGLGVGHALFTTARIGNSISGKTAAILAPLAVVPASQRKGVGGTLIREGCRLLAERRVALVFVLGDPAYYGRHGFEPAIPRGFPAPYPIVPEDAWQMRVLLPEGEQVTPGMVFCADTMAREEYWRE